IFLGGSSTAPSAWLIWIFRWILFRDMFGAGLIKLRGDPCWRGLTCLNYYFETQPIPNALSWYFHWLPAGLLRAGVLFNHVAALVLVIVMSVGPVLNMLSPQQLMNASFNPLHLVNTYGAFGSITRTRNEIVIEGTDDATVTAATTWRPYEFKGKPSEPTRLPA